MASSPPGDGSILPDGLTWSDIGHGLLDVVGVVPVFGEGADLVNAAWYAAEGNYLDAGLSVISMVPVVGDVIGKGGKIVKKAGGKLAGPALDALRKMDFKKTLEPLRKHPKIGPHVDKMVEALEKWRKDLIGEAPPCTPGGTQVCPLAGKSAASFAEGLAKMSPDAARQVLLKLPEKTRYQVLQELVTNPNLLKVDTAPGTAVFYSGRVKTSDGFISARTLAENLLTSGKATLESTPGGRFLEQLNVYKGLLPESQADEIWTSLSRRYADGATGPVMVYMGDMRPGAVLPHELKLLREKQALGSVTEIRIIDMHEMLERLGK